MADFDTVNTSGKYNTNLFSWQGRIGRLRFFITSVVVAVIVTAINLLVEVYPELAFSAVYSVALLLVLIVLCAIGIFAEIKRLHDLKKPGWLCLLMIIPLVGFIFTIYLICAPSAWDPERSGEINQ